MSESRKSSESRSYGYAPITLNTSSESRSYRSQPSESRSYRSQPSESRSYRSQPSESRCSTVGGSPSINNSNQQQYNQLADIDRLIESLENGFTPKQNNSAKYNQALEKRQKKITQLKQLREEAIKQIEEENQIKQLEAENDKLDEAIADVKKLIKRRNPTPKKQSSGCYYYDDGESRSCGDGDESRW